MNEYPADVFRLLELAEAETPTREIPPELQNALTMVRNVLVRVVPAQLLGWTDFKTTTKRAHELCKGDVELLERDDKVGFKVYDTVKAGGRVWVSGSASGHGVHSWPENATVRVIVGPRPQASYSPEKLVLTPEGMRILALHREKPVTKGRRPGKPPKTETPAETKIIGALAALLQDKDHPREQPPTGRKVAITAHVSANTVKTFMQKVFKGQAQFEAAWRRGDVPAKLATVQYVPERHEEYNDGRPTTTRYRRAGRTPGSHEND